MYKENTQKFKRPVPDASRSIHIKLVMQRVYEIFKNYIRLFDIEKLLDRYKIEATGSKNMTELGFLLEELK